MTTLAPAPTVPAALEGDRLLPTAAGLGVALGVVDLTLQLTLPYPFANLANSSAVWALAAFALALLARTTPARAAAAGVLMLAVAVEAYYLAAIVTDRAGWASLVAPPTIAWLLFAVVAGVVFGVAGTWARGPHPWRAALGLAAASAVFLAEALSRLVQASALADLGTTLLTATAGVAVLLVAAADRAQLWRAAALVGPLALLGALAFALGF